MNDIVAALDDRTQGELREVLAKYELQRLGELREEAVAALAALGRHPADLRSPTLSLMTIGIRDELFSARLVERASPESAAWELTALGEEVAGLLARTQPVPDAAEQRRAQEEIGERFAKLEERFGPLD